MRQPDGLVAQVGAHQGIPRTGRITLVEYEIDDGQDRTQAVRQLVGLRYAVGDVGPADLGFGPHQSLRHGRFWYQECRSDLGGGEATEEAQRQGDLHVGGERRVAAGEDEAKLIVANRSFGEQLVPGVEKRILRVAVSPASLAAQAVDRPVACGGNDPPRRAGRHPLFPPSRQGHQECILYGFFGHVDVTEHADEDGHGPAVFATEDSGDLRVARDQRGGVQASGPRPKGRTSIGRVLARVILAAQASAASRSGALRIQKPPRCSFPST